ncbi:MAG: preprotein translocase subunit SecE [Pseudomonadota bacterium]
MAKKKKPAKPAKAASTGAAPSIEGKASEPERKKKKTNPVEFVQQVRNEGAKVTWTSRNETVVSTIMVLIMVAIMSLFFFGVDQLLRYSVCTILPIQCGG